MLEWYFKKSKGKIMKKSIFLLGSVIVATFFIGCSAKGPQFHSFEKPKNPNNGMLYVYRKSQLLGSTTAYSVIAGQYYIGAMKINGYANKELPAGNIKLHTSLSLFLKGSLLVHIPKNGIVCVKTYLGSELFEVVNMKQCKKEIKTTKKILE